MNLSESELESVRRRGWAAIATGLCGDDVLRAVSSTCLALGSSSSPRVDRLTVRPTLSHPSLTKACGIGEFPFHSDTVVWRIPARFVVLGCIDPGCSDRPTRISDSQNWVLSVEEAQQLRRAVFLVKNGRRSFLSAILGHRQTMRFDPVCMEPQTSEGASASQLVQSRARATAIDHHWSVGDVLILDNWRVLHARADGKQSTRTLVRSYSVDGGDGNDRVRI